MSDLDATRGPIWTYDPARPRHRVYRQRLPLRLWRMFTYRLFWRIIRAVARDEAETALIEHELRQHPDAWKADIE